MRFIGILSTICSVFLATSLFSPQQVFANGTSLTFLRPLDNEAPQKNLIIFVHGITGNNEETWKNPRAVLSWPEMIKNDSAFNTADIALFDYDSGFFARGQGSIDEISDQLIGWLEIGSLNRYDKIFFVAHSMGGLITRSAIMKLDNSTNTPFIFFLATPTAGSRLADYARKIKLDSEALEGLRKLGDNLFLQGEISDWKSFIQRHEIASHCFYERVDTFGFRVVEQESATLLCNKKSFPVFENHSRIVKPLNEGNFVYERLRFAYRSESNLSLMDFGDNDTVILTKSTMPNKSTIFAKSIKLEENITFENNILLVANTIDLNGYRMKGAEITLITKQLVDGIVDVSGRNGSPDASLNGNPAGKIVVAADVTAGVRFIAQGGNGLDGAAGRNGEDGAAGTHGRRGNCDGFGRWKSPQAGTDGGNGSNGLPGQNGGQGGDGGLIYILSRSEPEIYSVTVTGGEGGLGGRGGQGGRGGSGGIGGRGCVGLGGSSTNASNGLPGVDGLDGPDGRRGDRGEDGELLIRPLASFELVRNLLPSVEELPDYRSVIQGRLEELATRP